MDSAGYVDGVEVLWRPGCPFCMNLQRGLRRRAIETSEINIWENPEAAERVREATGGDETVPTVFVGASALVNPAVGDVVAAIEREFPDRARDMLSGRTEAAEGNWWSRMTAWMRG